MHSKCPCVGRGTLSQSVMGRYVLRDVSAKSKDAKRDDVLTRRGSDDLQDAKSNLVSVRVMIDACPLVSLKDFGRRLPGSG